LGVTAASLPLYVVRWRYGPFPTTLLEALIWITVAAYAVTLWSERRGPQARTPFDIPIALLLLAGAISVVDAPDPFKALGTYRAYFLEAIACFYIAVDLLRGRREITTFLGIAGVGVCAMAAGQIASFLIALARHDLNLSAAPAFLNTSANSDAMYFEPPFAFAVGFTLFASRPRERWIAGAVLALVGIALVVSFSRASYLALAVLAGVLVLSTQNPRRRLRAIAGLAVLGLIVIEIPFVNMRFQTLANSVANRESLYTQALQMLAHMPITGAGLDGFATRVAPYRPHGSVIHIYPHDMWLTTWSELGLLGVIAFGIVFFGLLWTGLRALPLTRDLYRPLLWGAVGALVLYLAHGFFDSPYWKNDLSVEYWLLAALQVVAVRSTRLATADAESVRGPQTPEVFLDKDPRLRRGSDEREREVKRP